MQIPPTRCQLMAQAQTPRTRLKTRVKLAPETLLLFFFYIEVVHLLTIYAEHSKGLGTGIVELYQLQE